MLSIVTVVGLSHTPLLFILVRLDGSFHPFVNCIVLQYSFGQSEEYSLGLHLDWERPLTLDPKSNHRHNVVIRTSPTHQTRSISLLTEKLMFQVWPAAVWKAPKSRLQHCTANGRGLKQQCRLLCRTHAHDRTRSYLTLLNLAWTAPRTVMTDGVDALVTYPRSSSSSYLVIWWTMLM